MVGIYTGIIKAIVLGLWLLSDPLQCCDAAWVSVSSFSCRHLIIQPQSHARRQPTRSSQFPTVGRLAAAAATTTTPTSSPLPGADIEQPLEEVIVVQATTASARTDVTMPQAPSPLTTLLRGKVNEIDFCIAPADVSLSRAYSNAASSTPATTTLGNTADIPSEPSETRVSSLTRFLNNASNRAVRRILLARSWPSAEALNLSLRRAAEQQRLSASLSLRRSTLSEDEEAKCPVPRPILNILMRRWGAEASSTSTGRSSISNNMSGGGPVPRSRTDEEYVADQLKAFREKYGTVPGYALAEAYLECILSLATSGVESPSIKQVIESGVYDESYRRVKNVLKSVGAVFEPADNESIVRASRFKIASKLLDQDFCLSMLDKINLRRESTSGSNNNSSNGAVAKNNGKQTIPASQTVQTTLPIGINGGSPTTSMLPANGKGVAPAVIEKPEVTTVEEKKTRKFTLNFWKLLRRQGKNGSSGNNGQLLEGSKAKVGREEEEEEITRDDLGAVLLSSEEPSVTRQLNVLSNIVHRALLFGGDQELLVLSETLDADLPPFVERWYPGTLVPIHDSVKQEEQRPGVQYYNCLVELLKTCYRDGVIRTLDSPLPLIPSYGNAYERLTASLVELGSGYIKPITNVMTLPKPRNAQEELGRFAVWESTFRKTGTPDTTLFPEDLVGSWEVKDEIGGKIIGVSTVGFLPDGHVQVAAPMEGLRWRLDPGPTHLDTCTFQVLNDDGTVLQYRGFIDRGARLEARFSGRPIKIRGSVMFQMRDGDAASAMADDYWKDMLPINYRTGTTKFVMTKNMEDSKRFFL